MYAPVNVTATRVLEAMKAASLDQPGLAQELGVAQGTISKIVSGRTLNSRHLPRIAVRLGVSLPYLLGESDDPTGGARDSTDLTPREIELLERFSLLSDRARDALMTLIDEFAPTPGRTVHGNRHTYRAQSRGG